MTLMLLGLAVNIAAKLALWRSFGLVAANRGIRGGGPYRYVRHPIYLAGLLITVGEVWLRWSPAVVALNVVFGAAQVVRLRYEEAVLERTFPEYAAYRSRTSCIIPGIA